MHEGLMKLAKDLAKAPGLSRGFLFKPHHGSYCAMGWIGHLQGMTDEELTEMDCDFRMNGSKGYSAIIDAAEVEYGVDVRDMRGLDYCDSLWNWNDFAANGMPEEYDGTEAAYRRDNLVARLLEAARDTHKEEHEDD